MCLSKVSRDRCAIPAAYRVVSAGYRTIKIHSAYLGKIEIDAYDLGRGWVAMQTIVPGLAGKPSVFVKEIDAKRHNIDTQYNYNMNYLSSIQPTLVNIRRCARNKRLIRTLEKKQRLTKEERRQLHKAYTYNNVVDIHFNACNYVKFLHKYMKKNNVLDNNLFVSVHNVPGLDNAFWTGEYMVYGNGQSMFYPLGTIDIGGHEAGHGLVQAMSGLVYRGHAGALNESFADVLGVCFEFFTYENFRVRGKSDWLIGEDSGKTVKYLRNMKDPHNADFPQPKCYKDEFWVDPNELDNDYGGVHSNSGVGNYTFYTLSQRIGWEDALGIFWACLCNLSPTSDYIVFRDTLLKVSGRFLRHVESALRDAGLDSSVISDDHSVI